MVSRNTRKRNQHPIEKSRITREVKEESHLERRFSNIWNMVAADLLVVKQKKGVVPGRRFIYDFEIVGKSVLIECQGGVFSRGNSGHSSGLGIQRDAEKVNQAQINGYYIFVLTPEKITIEYLTQVAAFCRGLCDTTETVTNETPIVEELG